MKRGRPRKSAIAKAEAAPAPDAREAVSTPAETKADKEASALAEALREALRPLIDDLKNHLAIVARLAAADTLHSCELADTVISRAIKEGVAASRKIKESVV